MTELATAQLVDPELGAGTKKGYLFQAAPSVTTPEFLWFSVASPTIPTKTGERYFCGNQSGVIFYTRSGAIGLNTSDCHWPASVLPLR